MKQLRKNALRLVVVFCVLFVIVSVYAVYLVSSNESRLLSSTFNIYARDQRSRAVRGDILDRNGVVLATSDSEDNRVYNEDALVRTSTVHAVGIQSSKMPSSAEYMFSAYLYGLNGVKVASGAADQFGADTAFRTGTCFCFHADTPPIIYIISIIVYMTS